MMGRGAIRNPWLFDQFAPNSPASPLSCRPDVKCCNTSMNSGTPKSPSMSGESASPTPEEIHELHRGRRARFATGSFSKFAVSKQKPVSSEFVNSSWITTNRCHSTPTKSIRARQRNLWVYNKSQATLPMHTNEYSFLIVSPAVISSPLLHRPRRARRRTCCARAEETRK